MLNYLKDKKPDFKSIMTDFEINPDVIIFSYLRELNQKRMQLIDDTKSGVLEGDNLIVEVMIRTSPNYQVNAVKNDSWIFNFKPEYLVDLINSGVDFNEHIRWYSGRSRMCSQDTDFNTLNEIVFILGVSELAAVLNPYLDSDKMNYIKLYGGSETFICENLISLFKLFNIDTNSTESLGYLVNALKKSKNKDKMNPLIRYFVDSGLDINAVLIDDRGQEIKVIDSHTYIRSCLEKNIIEGDINILPTDTNRTGKL